MGISIRPMAVDDAGRVGELTRQLGYEASTSDLTARIERMPAGSVAFLAVDDGEIVGWIHGLNRELLFYPRILEIGGLVVDGTRRGEGIGRLLVEALADWGRERGHTLIFARSNTKRDQAHRFYEDLGFRREKESYTFSLGIS